MPRRLTHVEHPAPTVDLFEIVTPEQPVEWAFGLIAAAATSGLSVLFIVLVTAMVLR